MDLIELAREQEKSWQARFASDQAVSRPCCLGFFYFDRDIRLTTALHHLVISSPLFAQEAVAEAKKNEIALVQAAEEEKRRTMKAESDEVARRAQYNDQLARKRYDDQLRQQQQVNERERQLQEASVSRQEQERRRTLKYEQELRQDTEIAKVCQKI